MQSENSLKLASSESSVFKPATSNDFAQKINNLDYQPTGPIKNLRSCSFHERLKGESMMSRYDKTMDTDNDIRIGDTTMHLENPGHGYGYGCPNFSFRTFLN